jgi:hypothetical protein
MEMEEKAKMEKGVVVGDGNESGVEGAVSTGTEVSEATTGEIINILAETTITLTMPATTTSTSQPSSESNNNNNNSSSSNKDNSRIQEPVENDFFDVLRLQSHFEDWDEEDQKDWNKQSHIVLSLLEMAGLTEIASVPGPGSEGEAKQELHTLTSIDVKRLISALESNAFGMFDRTKKKPVCFGRGKLRKKKKKKKE